MVGSNNFKEDSIWFPVRISEDSYMVPSNDFKEDSFISYNS